MSGPNIILAPILDAQFSVSVREYPARLLARRCPGPAPTWVAQLVANGLQMSLRSLMIQAGRHFSDRVNQHIFSSAVTRRQGASAIAWSLIAMVQPYTQQDRLLVIDPGDSDIKRLCSEILGVGAALELLRLKRVIDGRTIGKTLQPSPTDRFDFTANGLSGFGRIYIEAKGTFNGVSVQQHRKSFTEKLTQQGLITKGKPRGYDRAVGITFSTWTEVDREWDVELLDPEREPQNRTEEAIREAIRFYARRFDEAVGKPEAAEMLFALASSSRLFRGEEPGLVALGTHERHSRYLTRSSLKIRMGNLTRTFLGGFWEPRALPVPLAIPNRENIDYKVAYVGIDGTVIDYIRERRFQELLDYRGGEDQLFEMRDNKFVGHFQLDAYGILRGLMNEEPDQKEFAVLPQ